MSFIFEVVGHFIKSNMEDPKERRKWWTTHIERVDAGRKRVKAAIDQPVRPFGFWTSDKANARYHTNLDPGVSSLPGRIRAQDE